MKRYIYIDPTTQKNWLCPCMLDPDQESLLSYHTILLVPYKESFSL